MTGLLATTGNAKALWYLTRGTGAVALLLLTAGVVLGVMTSNRWTSTRLPRFVVTGLHRNLTLLAVALVAVHVVTTVADRFAPIGIREAVVPFLSPYRPIWLGLGAVAFDLLLALIVTSLLRAHIGFRPWRAIHWLAYACWPIALVHALGTGSDPRTRWLAVLSIACGGAVVLAALWRVGAARKRPVTVRVGAALAAVAVPFAVVGWARSGPLEKGWAARAGTPRSLLASSRLAAARAVLSQASAVSATPTKPADRLPLGPFEASFHGRLRTAPAQNGLVTVAIDGTSTGAFSGRVHVALRGVPLDGGGVQMLDSSVGLLPRGADAWSAGQVVALEGQQILADVRRSDGKPLRVLLALQIDPNSGSVSGVIRGGGEGFGDDAGERGPSE